jgi:hypothetical protein
MRSIITQPLYRALKTLSERKSAFNTYIEQEAKRERVWCSLTLPSHDVRKVTY